MAGWWQKIFSDHPDSEMDGHKRSFATIQQVWMVTKKPFMTIQILNWILKLMQMASTFSFTGNPF